MEVDEKEANAGNFKKLTSLKRQGEEVEENLESLQIVAQKQVVKALDSFENRIQKMMDMLTYLESKVEKFRMSAYNPHWSEVRGLDEVLQSTNRISLADRFGVSR